MKREKQTTSLNKLIIKVKEGERIQKNIGRIFRKYNIIEYKEPGETLTINDFYKGYGDGCFYLSNIDLESDIQPKELTITFISNSYQKTLELLSSEKSFLMSSFIQNLMVVFLFLITLKIIFDFITYRHMKSWHFS